MNFLEGREKIAFLRKKLNISTEELATENLTKDYLQLLESGNSIISKDVSKLLICRFKQIALEKELNLDIELDENFFLRTKQEEAKRYCVNHLNTNSSIDELEILLTIAKEYNLDFIKAQIYTKIGDYYFDINNYNTSLENYFTSLNLLNSINSDTISFSTYIYKKIGSCYYSLLDYYNAISYFSKCKSIAEKINQTSLTNTCIYNLSLCYMNIKEYDKSIELSKIFINSLDNDPDSDLMPNYYIYSKSVQASCYALKGSISDAIEILESICSSDKPIDSKVLAHIYTNLSSFYTEDNQLDKATLYSKKAQDIRSKIDIEKLPHTLIEKASIYMKKGLYNNALSILNKVVIKSKESNNNYCLMNAYELLKEIYINLNDYKRIEEVIQNIIGLASCTNNHILSMKSYNELLRLYSNYNNFKTALEYNSKMDFVLKTIT